MDGSGIGDYHIRPLRALNLNLQEEVIFLNTIFIPQINKVEKRIVLTCAMILKHGKLLNLVVKILNF